MDFRAGIAVVVFLCLHITPAAFLPVDIGEKEEAWRATINMTLEEIRTSIDYLTDPELFPNVSCAALNVPAALGPERRTLGARHLSSIRCFLRELSRQELSRPMPMLAGPLTSSVQYLLDVELLQGNQTVQVTCQLPTFEQDLDFYQYAKCLLQVVEERLSDSTISLQ